MNEFSHLINDYLCRNSTIINNGFNCLTKEELRCTLHNLTPFNDKSPDMFSAVLKDKIILLEHFEFDASRSTRKGMEGKREENALAKRIKNSPCQADPCEWNVEKVEYDISLADWKKNFEATFTHHYNRIDSYIKNVQNHLNDFKRPILVGFVIKNQFSPSVMRNGKWFGELPYCNTKQFADFFSQQNRVDFVMFIGYLGGKPQVIYLDHDAINAMQDLVDIGDGSVSLSNLNKNEIIVHCKYRPNPHHE